jgi:hypothetical protein
MVASRTRTQSRLAFQAIYAQVAKACGLNPQRMLLDSKLPDSSLSECDLMLSVDRVDLLLEKSAEQNGNWCFGLDMAKNRRLSHLGELGLLLRDLSSPGRSLFLRPDEL